MCVIDPSAQGEPAVIASMTVRGQIRLWHFLVFAVLPIAVALTAGPFLWRTAGSLAIHISGWDAQRDYLWGIAWAPVLGLTILAWPVPREEKKALAIAWGAKVAVVLGFMIYYEAHYGALDAWGYYARALTPGFDPSTWVVGDATSNMYVLSWAFARIAPDSYHALKLTYAYVGLLGVYCLYRASSLVIGTRDVRVLLLLALFPSILFWSSILGKDPVVVFAIGLSTLGVAMLYRKRAWWAVPLGLGALVFLFFRPWLLVMVVVPTVLVGGWIAQRGLEAKKRAIVIGCVALVLAMVALVVFVYVAHDTHSDLLGNLNRESRSWATGGSGQTPPVFTSFWSALAFLPWGAFTALFRPLPGEISSSIFGVLAGVEDLVVLAGCAFALGRARFRDLLWPPVAWGLLFVAIWVSFYAFISYQNLGTAARFRLQVLPMIILLVVWIEGRRRGMRMERGS